MTRARSRPTRGRSCETPGGHDAGWAERDTRAADAWTALRDAGYLDSGALEGTGVVTRWNAAPLGAAGILIVLAVLAATFI